MATRRSVEEHVVEDLQAPPASSSNKNSKTAEIAHHHGEEKEGGEGIGAVIKAPVHDASSAAHKSPAAAQAQTKADLAKAAQTLKQDAAEGEV